MLKLIAPLGFATTLVLATAPPAAAYNCNIPAIVDPNKQAVCGTPRLRQLNADLITSDQNAQASVPAQSRPVLTSARAAFAADRRGCNSDTRCLDAVYRAQVRLFSALSRCATTPSPTAQTACLRRSYDRHRESLHRSM